MEIDQFFFEHTYSENTTDRYRRALKDFEAKIKNIRKLSAAEFRTWLFNHETWGDSTRWIAYTAVREYLRWKFGESHQALKLKIKRGPSKPQRALKNKTAEDLLSSFDSITAKGIRDLAICALMLDTGLRASEVCRLRLDDIDLDERSLTVKIKGGKWGSGIYSCYTENFLRSWIDIRLGFAAQSVQEVFISIGGLTRGKSLTREGLNTIVEKWGERIGIKLCPHDLRRSFATISTRAGAPARVLQIAGRWSSMEMVERYTRTLEASDFEPYFPVIKLSRP